MGDPAPSWVAGAVVAGGVAAGVLAEALAYDLREVALWAPDLLTGSAFIGAAAAVLGHRRAVGYGLLAVAGTWFAGTVFPLLLHVHRGPLIHLLLRGTGRRRAGPVGVAMGYAAALVPVAWRDDRIAAVLVVGLVAVAGRDLLVARGRTRDDRRWSLRALGAFAAVVLGGVLVRRVLPLEQGVAAALLAYDVLLVGLAVAVAARARPRTDAVVDRVVELGEAPSGSLRDALAQAVRDPSLQVGYRSSDGGYRDDAGAVVTPPTGPGRVATVVEQAGQPLAILVHDATALEDPELVDAVAAATRLSAAHRALTDEARSRSAELERSRRRLVLAADEERRRLEARLHHVVERPLEGLVAQLRALPVGNPHIDRAAAHLADSLDELGAIARGLHPRELDGGLAPALAALAARCPLPVQIDAGAEGAPHAAPEIEVAAYYLVAEALSNAVKYAGATTRVRVAVHRSAATITVEIVDDGRGGARPLPGSGLSGLQDRVAALGGSFEVSSPVGAGTRIAAELPLGGDVTR